MDRRNFMKLGGGAVSLAFLTPMIKEMEVLVPSKASSLVSEPVPMPKHSSEYVENKMMDGGVLDLTDNFFIYMQNHPWEVKYTYDRITTPSFLAFSLDKVNMQLVSTPLIASSRKMKMACPGDENLNSNEIMNVVFKSMLEETNYDTEMKKSESSKLLNHAFYILALYTTPVIFDISNYYPRRGFIMRYETFSTENKIITQRQGMKTPEC